MPFEHQIATLFYMLTGLALVIAVFHVNRSYAQISAVVAIVLVLIGNGFLLSYVPEEKRYEVAAPTVAAKQKPAQQAAQDGDGSEGAGAPDSQSAAAGGGGGGGGAGDGAGRSGADGPQGNGNRAAAARAMSVGFDPKTAGEVGFKDCPECPQMMLISPGQARIGASDTEKADPAERPARTARIWPGFAMSRVEISLAEFERAALKPLTSGACSNVGARSPDAPVTCVGQSEINKYLKWLSDKTGKRYRLPTAAEWEFAARTAAGSGGGVDNMGGGVAERVADCWSETLPDSTVARETFYAGASCRNNVVKDGADEEDSYWKRPSARRSLGSSEGSPTVGFRVVRETESVGRYRF